MIRTVHHKLHTNRDLTELSDYQLIAVPFIMMGDMTLKIRISNIREVSDDNVRIGDRRLYIDFFLISRNGMLFFSNVDTIDPTTVRWSAIRFQRNNNTYRMLISLCQLILEGILTLLIRTGVRITMRQTPCGACIRTHVRMKNAKTLADGLTTIFISKTLHHVGYGDTATRRTLLSSVLTKKTRKFFKGRKSLPLKTTFRNQYFRPILPAVMTLLLLCFTENVMV
jgi:hypothetical protein